MSINSTGDSPQRLHLVSTKNYVSPSLERFQLMVEDLLEKAHREGLNLWYRTDDGPLPLWIGAVWMTGTQYELRFSGDSSPIEPARIRSYTPRGRLEDNPVIQRPVTDFMEAARDILRRRDGDESCPSERFFGSENPHYPSLMLTLAPQQGRVVSQYQPTI